MAEGQPAFFDGGIARGGARKGDEGKTRYDLVPVEFTESEAEVFTFGAWKYGERNWELGLDPGRLYAAAMRHIQAHRKGELRDPESGLCHLAHARWNLGAMMLGIGHGENRAGEPEMQNAAQGLPAAPSEGSAGGPSSRFEGGRRISLCLSKKAANKWRSRAE
jgi:hypothetical protein